MAAIAMLLTPATADEHDGAVYGEQAQQTPARAQVGSTAPFLQSSSYLPAYQPSYVAGRTRVIVSSTLASFVAGLQLPDILQVQDLRAGATGVFVTTAAGFLASTLAVKDRKITEAMADAYDLGLLLGAANGGLLAGAATDDERTISGAMLGGMTLGGFAGMSIARQLNPTRGQVGFVALTSKMGMASAAFGLGLGGQAMDDDNSLGALVAGMDIGAVAGLAVAPRIKWSLSRTRLVGLGSFLGALAGWSAAAVISGGDITQVNGKGQIQDSTSQAMAAGALLGMWGGFGITSKLTSKMPVSSRYQGKKTIISPTQVKGGLGLSLSGVF